MQDTKEGGTSKDVPAKLPSPRRDPSPLLVDNRSPRGTGHGDPDTLAAQPVKLLLPFWARASLPHLETPGILFRGNSFHTPNTSRRKWKKQWYQISQVALNSIARALKATLSLDQTEPTKIGSDLETNLKIG